jgi:hypothetical protein
VDPPSAQAAGANTISQLASESLNNETMDLLRIL